VKRREAATGWPATLRHGPLVVRPLVLRDAAAWVAVRRRNTDWLSPWESTPPGRTAGESNVGGFLAYAVEQRRLAGDGLAMPFVLEWQGDLVGQVTVAGITRGAMQSASVGYWIDQGHAGRGIVPTALAMVIDHCFTGAGLHRIEVDVRPENTASLRVVTKLGLREEGLRRGLLYVDGAYRDHLAFAVLAEDVAPRGLLYRWVHHAPEM
jgi:ribosomal-protein-alanine N-acetyltransferase